MVVHKRKKSSRMRGAKTTHGYGSKKKNRGAGNRGGKGMAGTGKRADQKKPTILQLYGNAYYGKHGFHIPPAIKHDIRPTNLEHLDLHLDHYVRQGLATKEGTTYTVDLEKLGFNKLLGKGIVTHKITIKALHVTARAASKIQKAGGTVEANGDH